MTVAGPYRFTSRTLGGAVAEAAARLALRDYRDQFPDIAAIAAEHFGPPVITVPANFGGAVHMPFNNPLRKPRRQPMRYSYGAFNNRPERAKPTKQKRQRIARRITRQHKK